MKIQLTLLSIFILLFITQSNAQTSGFTYGNTNSNSIVKLYTSSVYNGNVSYINNFNQILNTTSNVNFAQVISPNLCYSNGTNCVAGSGGSSYNVTYATWLPNYTAYVKYWYNMTGAGSGGSYNATYAIWSYNQTYSGSTYNATYAPLVYNHTIATNLSLVNDYGKWWYNMTYSGSTYNATYANYASLVYNHTIASNSTIYIQYGKWFYNQTYSGSTYNSTYATYAYNYTSVPITPAQTVNNNLSNVQALNFSLNSGYISSNSTCIKIINGGSELAICQ